MDDRRLLYQIFAGVFGLVVGSFLNVVIFRLPRACMSIAAGRSRCPGCRQEIAWFDNIPVASWLALRGRCRTCDRPIPVRYTLVELLTGALFAWAAFVQLYMPSELEAVQRATLFAIQAYLIAAIVASTFIDLDFQILPDEINWTGLAFGLLAGAAFPLVLYGAPPSAVPGAGWLPADLQPHAWGLAQAVLGAFMGGGVILAIRIFGTLLFWWRVKRLKLDSAMGLGDVKYMAFLGAFLGWKGIALALVVAMLVGALYGIARAVVTMRLDPTLRERPERMGIGPLSFSMGTVPFGPFLSAGVLAVMFARPWIVRGIEAYLDLFRTPPPLP